MGPCFWGPIVSAWPSFLRACCPSGNGQAACGLSGLRRGAAAGAGAAFSSPYFFAAFGCRLFRSPSWPRSLLRRSLLGRGLRREPSSRPSPPASPLPSSRPSGATRRPSSPASSPSSPGLSSQRPGLLGRSLLCHHIFSLIKLKNTARTRLQPVPEQLFIARRTCPGGTPMNRSAPHRPCCAFFDSHFATHALALLSS